MPLLPLSAADPVRCQRIPFEQRPVIVIERARQAAQPEWRAFARWTIALRIVAPEGSLTRVRSGVSGMVPTDDYVQSLPRKRMVARALFVDSASRILLVDPVYRDTWDLPGGAVEAEESPYAACRREVAEELGLDRLVRTASSGPTRTA